MKALYFEGEKGNTVIEKDIPEDMMEMVRAKKLELLSHLADHD